MSSNGNGTSLTALRGDCAYLADLLADGRWHGLDEIHQASRRDRGHAFTVHSRVSDLRRKHGFRVEQRSERRNGRTISFYRLSPLDAIDDTPSPMGLPPMSSVASSGPAPNPDTPSMGADGAGASVGDEAVPLTCGGQLSLLEVAA